MHQLAKNNDKNLFDSAIILRFGETKVGKEKFYGTKKAINILSEDEKKGIAPISTEKVRKWWKLAEGVKMHQ